MLAERLGLAGLLSWSSSSSTVGTGASTIHNGPNLVALPGNAGYLGVAHISRRWAGAGGEWDNHYTSFVFRIGPAPPFALAAMSAEFCLDSIHRPGTSQCETIQFISGLLLSADGTELTIGTVRAPPQHRLSSKNMVLITSD